MPKVALVQLPSPFLDRAAAFDVAERAITTARGDAAGLRVVDSSAGRLGALICWENYMPLARFALYAQGVEIYVAPTWDHGETWLTSMRHIAREGRAWVLGSAVCMQGKDVPSAFP